MSTNWNDIRTISHSQNDGFEEFVCQLAKNETIQNQKTFIRKGKPDAGVECYWILTNGDEWAWQAKYFTSRITETQWKEIDHSVKTVLDKHPKLKKYIVAIPNDPSDARIKKQKSMLDRSQDRIQKWENWAMKKGLKVEFCFWWSTDLIERIQKTENAGLTYFWFNKEEFSDNWCEEQTKRSIADLGKRYTPELNVELEISKLFNGLSRDSEFKYQVEKIFDDLLTKANKLIPTNKDLEVESQKVQHHIKAIFDLFEKANFQGVEILPWKEFFELSKSLGESVDLVYDFYINEEKKLQKNAGDNRYYKKYGYEISHIREFHHSLNTFQDTINGETFTLSNNPFLLLEGEAGVGKSHLLADIVTRRNTKKLTSLFFLGQHFVTDDDPWIQIIRKNGIKCNVDEFLGSLNSKAQISGNRTVLFIDAVNEGRGKYFWDKNIRSFLLSIRKYEWLGLVLSIRTSYSKLIFPEDIISESEMIRYTHYGFRSKEFEAVQLFFDNYGIELPSIPFLIPEFQNPLFLILFCEGLKNAGLKKIPDGLQGLTSILDFYIKGINRNLSKPDRLDYPESINIVKNAIDLIISYKVENNVQFVPYEQAYLILNKKLSEYNLKRGLLDELISEGILSKNLFWDENNNVEGIYIAYERFDDHLTASLLIKTNSELEKCFEKDGNLYHLVKDERALRVNQGILDAFSIQIPEILRKELYEFIPSLRNNYSIIISFIQSLIWRKHETISNKLLDYINSEVLCYKRTTYLLFDTLISISSSPNQPFNANFLHKNLNKQKLNDRDSSWTIFLNDQFLDDTATKRLILWSLNNNNSHISDDAIYLSTVAIAWFHTSTHRELRDLATKSMVCLLENRIQVLIKLLKEFEGVNDPYVYERLYAVAYGCSMRTKDHKMLPDLCNYIYKTIFNKRGEVYPHVLLRDYARGVIEYSLSKGVSLGIDEKKIRPPYKSSFPKRFPSNRYIDQKYRFDPDSQDFKKHFHYQNEILDSMITEYGRGTGGYGDFGRYSFESAFHPWDIDANKLSNLAVKWIFEKYGYDVEEHGKHDRDLNRYGDVSNKVERIGKKYQWISLHEILARLADNSGETEQYNFRYKKSNSYEGPWVSGVRDIDPSLTIRKTGTFDKELANDFWWLKEKYSNWNLDNNNWSKTHDDLPSSEGLIQVIDDKKEEWLVLEGYPEWGESKHIGDEKWDKPQKRLWYQIRSYLVSEKNYNKVRDWSLKQNFMGRWMPESGDRSEIFSREFFWSPAYHYSYSDSMNGTEYQKVFDNKTGKLIGEVILTSDSFAWGKEIDNSKEGSIRFLKPSKYIFEGMHLRYSEKEGELEDEQGILSCIAPSVYNESSSYLLIKKKPFLNFLKNNRLKVLWTILGRKDILGGYSAREEFNGRLEISGAYYLNQDFKIEGKLNLTVT